MNWEAIFIYKDSDAFLYPQGLTVLNTWIDIPPFIRISWDNISLSEKRNVLDYTLSCSKEELPKPANWLEPGEKLLKFYGYKNWKSFYKNSKLVFINKNLEEYKFTPSIYDSSRGGHEMNFKLSKVIPVSSSEIEVINALNLTIENSV